MNWKNNWFQKIIYSKFCIRNYVNQKIYIADTILIENVNQRFFLSRYMPKTYETQAGEVTNYEFSTYHQRPWNDLCYQMQDWRKYYSKCTSETCTKQWLIRSVIDNKTLRKLLGGGGGGEEWIRLPKWNQLNACVVDLDILRMQSSFYLPGMVCLLITFNRERGLAVLTER